MNPTGHLVESDEAISIAPVQSKLSGSTHGC